MRLFAAAMFALVSGGAAAEDIVSEYTTISVEQHCSIAEAAAEGEGDGALLLCAGYRGYPVIIQYGDLRESVFYGFPPQGEMAWESFASFNATGPTIEWRIEKKGDVEIPFATIHRWFVSDPDDVDDQDEQIEVLVVEKVGQFEERQGCIVGYVVATGNPGANEQARRIADSQARWFACGDQPVVEAGDVPVPDFVRWEN